MNNMFKKSLVAVAVLGFSSSALAADLVNTPEWVSSEFVATAGAESVSKTVNVQLSTNYADNDTIRVQFSGVFPTSVSGGDINDGGAPATVVGTASVISYNAETGLAILRATGVTGNTSGNQFDITAEFDYADVTENTTVSYQAYLGNSETEIGSSDTATIFGVASQFASVTAAAGDRLTATIDVSTERKQFIDVDTDAAVFEVSGEASISDDLPTTTPATTFDTIATLDSTTYTVTGNFGWLLDANGDYIGGGVIEACGGTTEGAANDFVLTATTVTFECTVAPVAPAAFFAIDVTGLELTIPTQTFTIGAEVAYTNPVNTDVETNEGSATLSAVNFGEWTLNGSDVFVSYVPFRGGISQVINITNRSTQDGSVSVVAIDEAGNEFELNDIATSEAGTITAIAGAINSALSTATGLDLHPVNGQSATKRYALRIITNAPEGDIEVYSAYNVGGSGARLVVNSSNGK